MNLMLTFISYKFHTGEECHGTLYANGKWPSGVTKSGVDTARKPSKFNIYQHRRVMKQTQQYYNKKGNLDEYVKRPVQMDKTPTGAADGKLTVRIAPLLSIDHANLSQEFKPFPKLPPEIREMIWLYAAREPRLVRWGKEPLLGIAHANKESRLYALKENKFINNPQHPFFINVERDILYYLTALPTHKACRGERKRYRPLMKSGVKRLALPLDDCFQSSTRFHYPN